MPRGKYDRKESKIHRLESELTEAKKKLHTQREELEKKDIELKAAKKIADTMSKIPQIEVLPAERFQMLRDNLKVLSESRRVLVDSDQMSPVVLNTIDDEIGAHLRLLGSLRQESFGMRDEAKATTTEVPLPAQVPPFFPQHFKSAKVG